MIVAASNYTFYPGQATTHHRRCFRHDLIDPLNSGFWMRLGLNHAAIAQVIVLVKELNVIPNPYSGVIPLSFSSILLSRSWFWSGSRCTRQRISFELLSHTEAFGPLENPMSPGWVQAIFLVLFRPQNPYIKKKPVCFVVKIGSMMVSFSTWPVPISGKIQNYV